MASHHAISSQGAGDYGLIRLCGTANEQWTTLSIDEDRLGTAGHEAFDHCPFCQFKQLDPNALNTGHLLFLSQQALAFRASDQLDSPAIKSRFSSGLQARAPPKTIH